MSWRDSAGLTIAVTALLGLSAQPAARWIVNRAVSQYASGATTMAGRVSWDPVAQTWICNRIRVETSTGPSVQAARATVRLDTSELFCRNLVIDSAKIEGIVVHVPKGSSDPSLPASSSSSTFPIFSLDAWADAVLNQHKRDVLAAAQRRDQRRQELRLQLDRLNERCVEVEKASTPNPLRSRMDIQEVRRDIAQLLQALAEERIQSRETDRKLETAIERFQVSWSESLAQSVTKLLPERPQVVRHLADQNLTEYWGSRGYLMSYATATARPLQEIELPSRGRHVSLPGLPTNHLKIRSANLAGTIEIEDRQPIRFHAALRGWGDASSAINTRSDWHFEVANAPSAIEAHVEMANEPEEDSGTAKVDTRKYPGWIITWKEPTVPDLTSRMRWQTSSDGDRFDLSIPVDHLLNMSQSNTAVVFEGKMDWQACWNSAMEHFRGRYMHASLKLASSDSVRLETLWRCRQPDVSQESLALLSEIWEQTLAEYVQQLARRARPRIGTMQTAMAQFCNQCWREGNQSHQTFLEEFEREVQRLKTNWDEYGSLSDRLARMRGGNADDEKAHNGTWKQ